MVLNIAAIINKRARRNKDKSRVAEEEALDLRRELGSCGLISVDTTPKPELVTSVCARYIEEGVNVVILSGGDGTVQNFLTHHFKELYRRYRRSMTPIEFAHALNRMALDPTSDVSLPALYHRSRGTVNAYADTLGMRGDLEAIAENLTEAERRHAGSGITAFDRVYVPMLLLYSKDEPRDLDKLHVMALYADGSIYNFFEQYYAPKERGEDPSLLTAMRIIARGASSAMLSAAVDAWSSRLAGSPELGRRFYRERFIEQTIRSTPGTVTVDGHALPYPARSVTAIGTMSVSLYGIKPFWRMPRRPVDFGAYFPSQMEEIGSDLDYRGHTFQLFCGDISGMDIAKALHLLYLGRQTGIAGLTDTVARRVEIRQDVPLDVIVDGTRDSVGKSVVVEIAYLQPFIRLDRKPMK